MTCASCCADRKTFVFLLAMPSSSPFRLRLGLSAVVADQIPRLPVGYLDQDHSKISGQLHDLLAARKLFASIRSNASAC
jgi:hypothetical protein